jgi:pimeloyl-ACP methyl ester carboxylesterase
MVPSGAGQDIAMCIRLGLFFGLALAMSACTPAPVQTPTSADPPVPARIYVKTVDSRDGTRIAVECAGEGPTLLMVHGGVGDRTRWTPMIPLLAKGMRACAMDRRGRGGSGDNADYGMYKEAEDVAAVADSFRGDVFVMGHSYGGVAAYEAAFLTGSIKKLILYEAPFQDPVDRNLEVAGKVEKLIAEGKPEEALVVFQTEIVGQSAEAIAAMKARPNWPLLVETIKVHPRQMRALAAYRFDIERAKTLNLPVLLIAVGDTGSPYLRQAMETLDAAAPNSTLFVLEGQQHNAMDSGPEALAARFREFVGVSSEPHN